MAEETTTTVTAPKTRADLKAMTSLKTTEASDSFCKFMNENLAHIDGYTPVTPEQAWIVLYGHRVWQQSEERAAEKVALKEAAEKATAEKKAERERKAEEKKVADAKKAADKKAKDEAKKAAEADSDDDLDSVDADAGEGEIKVAKTRKRPAPKSAPASEAVDAGEGNGF